MLSMHRMIFISLSLSEYFYNNKMFENLLFWVKNTILQSKFTLKICFIALGPSDTL